MKECQMADAQQDGTGAGLSPPYIAYQTLKTLLEGLKPHKLPGRIDRSLLRNFSGTNQAQIIPALRFLGLTDANNHPTDRLAAALASYGTDQWPDALQQLLRDKYGPLFESDLASASPSQFAESFRKAFPNSETVLRKARTFFLNAANEA